MPDKPPRIWIVTARVGAGHLQAARAVQEALAARGLSDRVRFIDAMTIVPAWFRAFYAGGYTLLVTRHPRLYGRLYDVSDVQRESKRDGLRSRLRDAVGRMRRAGEALVLRSLRRRLLDDRPDWVVHTHFLAPPALASWIAGAGLPTRQAVVVTDLHPHAVWVDDRVDRYYVAVDQARETLLRRGVEPDRVRVTGIPILAKHRRTVDRADTFRSFDWPPDRPVILLVAGSDFVVGPIESVVEKLLGAFPDATLQVATGHNARLTERLCRLGRRRPQLRIVGYTDRMHDLIGAATVVISKTGGVTTSECLAHGAALVAMYPVPGQERWNADYLSQRGAALTVTRVPEVVPAVRSVLTDPVLRASMQRAARMLARPAAADDIVSDLLEAAPNRSES